MDSEDLEEAITYHYESLSVFLATQHEFGFTVQWARVEDTNRELCYLFFLFFLIMFVFESSFRPRGARTRKHRRNHRLEKTELDQD